MTASSRSAPCSPASEVSSSASNGAEDSRQDGNARTIPMPVESSPSIGPGSRSMRTFGTSRKKSVRKGSMCYAVDSHVRTFPKQDDELESEENVADCSSRPCGLFAHFDRNTSSWRTWQRSLIGGLTQFSESWPYAGMMRNGIVLARPPSGRSTDVIVCSSWPTPTVADTFADKLKSNQQTPGSLHSVKLAQAVHMIPTPCAHHVDLGTMMMRYSGQARKKNLPGTAYGPANRGMLNPTWVEWLMGFQIGWTDLAGSETPSCLNAPSSSELASSNVKEGA